MSQTITLIPGDSIGREVAEATRRVVDAAGADIDWHVAEAGRAAYARTGDALPPATLEAIRTNKFALKGRIATPIGGGYESPNVRLRKELDLFVSVRPVRHLPGLECRYEGVDLVVIRECTEDVYSGIEHKVYPGVIQLLKVTTRAACERAIRYAFEYAQTRGRRRVTLVHKANIMKLSDGLFLRTGRALAPEYPDIEFDDIIADNACMQMVRNPQRFDVLLCQNLFGDLLSDLGAGLVGGISGGWGVLVGPGGVHVFEAIHGIAPDIEGMGIANPLPMLQPAMSLLRKIGQEPVATRITEAIGATLGAGIRTPDLGGTATTNEFVTELLKRLPE